MNNYMGFRFFVINRVAKFCYFYLITTVFKSCFRRLFHLCIPIYLNNTILKSDL